MLPTCRHNCALLSGVARLTFNSQIGKRENKSAERFFWLNVWKYSKYAWQMENIQLYYNYAYHKRVGSSLKPVPWKRNTYFQITWNALTNKGFGLANHWRVSTEYVAPKRNARGRQIFASSRTETHLWFLFPRILGCEGAVLCNLGSLGSTLPSD